MSKVGADAFGTMLTGTLREVGVDTRGVVVAEDAFTTLAFVTLDARGEALIFLCPQAGRGHATPR